MSVLCFSFELSFIPSIPVATCNIRIVQPVIFTGSYFCNFTTQLSWLFLQVISAIAFMFISFNSLGLHLACFLRLCLQKNQTSQEIRYILVEEYAHACANYIRTNVKQQSYQNLKHGIQVLSNHILCQPQGLLCDEQKVKAFNHSQAVFHEYIQLLFQGIIIISLHIVVLI